MKKMKNVKPHGYIPVYVPEDKAELLKKLEELRWQERSSISGIVIKALEEYLKRHGSGNPSFVMEKWIDQNDFKISPAFFETTQSWNNYLSKCNQKEVEQVEERALHIVTLSRNYYKNRKSIDR